MGKRLRVGSMVVLGTWLVKPASRERRPYSRLPVKGRIRGFSGFSDAFRSGPMLGIPMALIENGGNRAISTPRACVPTQPSAVLMNLRDWKRAGA